MAGGKEVIMHNVVFDIEVIHNPEGPEFTVQLDGREQTVGWQLAHFLGISVACTYDPEKDEFKDWLQGEAYSLLRYLRSFEQVIGFNSFRFDYQVLGGAVCQQLGLSHGAVSPKEWFAGKTVDLMLDFMDLKRHRIGLENLCQATLGLQERKLMEGEYAPQAWASGLKRETIVYCRDDVRKTWELFQAAQRGELSWRPRNRNPEPLVDLRPMRRDGEGQAVEPATDPLALRQTDHPHTEGAEHEHRRSNHPAGTGTDARPAGRDGHRGIGAGQPERRPD